MKIVPIYQENRKRHQYSDDEIIQAANSPKSLGVGRKIYKQRTVQEITEDATYNTVWAGMTAAKAKNMYEQIYAVGTLSQAHFGVKLSAYFQNSEIGKLHLLQNSSYLPFLAQSVEASLLSAQSDSANVGHYPLHHIGGNNLPEMQIGFLETKDAVIANNIMAIKEMMFHKDGTQGLPKDYLMRLDLFAFDRHNFELKPFKKSWIVALQDASISFESSAVNGVVVIPVTFTKMLPNLKLSEDF